MVRLQAQPRSSAQHTWPGIGRRQPPISCCSSTRTPPLRSRVARRARLEEALDKWRGAAFPHRRCGRESVASARGSAKGGLKTRKGHQGWHELTAAGVIRGSVTSPRISSSGMTIIMKSASTRSKDSRCHHNSFRRCSMVVPTEGTSAAVH